MKIYILVEKVHLSGGHGEPSWPVETFAGSTSYERPVHPAFISKEVAQEYLDRVKDKYDRWYIKELPLFQENSDNIIIHG